MVNMDENGPFSLLNYLLNMLLFHGYVSLPEGKD